MSVLELRRDLGKAHEGKPRSEPDRGNPAVRDRRGACGIVMIIGSRTEAHRETDGVATEPYRHSRAALLSRLPFVAAHKKASAGLQRDKDIP